jgi:hypothetical protein
MCTKSLYEHEDYLKDEYNYKTSKKILKISIIIYPIASKFYFKGLQN